MQLSSDVFGAERDHEGHAGGARTGARPPAATVRGQVVSNGQVLLAALRRKPDPTGGTKVMCLGRSFLRRVWAYPGVAGAPATPSLRQ